MQLQMDKVLVEFRVDIGAEVTVISEGTFHKLSPETTFDIAKN